jgi:hypothetical protein
LQSYVRTLPSALEIAIVHPFGENSALVRTFVGPATKARR